MPRRARLAGWFGATLSVSLLHCSATPHGASDSGIARARCTAAPGADAFDRECASCHGKRGEGLGNTPPIMGPGALAEHAPASAAGQPPRGPFRSAQDVYDYLSLRMPLPKPVAGTLSPAEYWAIVNYMLLAQGVVVPPGGVTEANAKRVSLRAGDFGSAGAAPAARSKARTASALRGADQILVQLALTRALAQGDHARVAKPRKRENLDE
jgi:mono/diheme cytochrome c family protein